MDVDKKVVEFLKLEKLEGFSFKDLMSDVFKRHDPTEMEDVFAVGTTGHVPEILEVDSSWPHPWMFFRAFAASVVAYLVLAIGWCVFENTRLLPGIILMGTVAMPISVLIFFFEVNVTRNVPVKEIVRLFFLGGVASIVLSLFLYLLPIPGGSLLGDMVAGLVEEPGKLLIILLFARRTLRYRYKLNGLLFGAAVGTGFAVFESMGYAFDELLEQDGSQVTDMNVVIILRGLLAPFGHVLWSAIVGHALWRVQENGVFGRDFLGDKRFYPLMIAAIVLHMLWDAGDWRLIIAVSVAGVAVVLRLVQEGLCEVRAFKLAEYQRQFESFRANDGVIDPAEQAVLDRLAAKYGIEKDVS